MKFALAKDFESEKSKEYAPLKDFESEKYLESAAKKDFESGKSKEHVPQQDFESEVFQSLEVRNTRSLKYARVRKTRSLKYKESTHAEDSKSKKYKKSTPAKDSKSKKYLESAPTKDSKSKSTKSLNLPKTRSHKSIKIPHTPAEDLESLKYCTKSLLSVEDSEALYYEDPTPAEGTESFKYKEPTPAKDTDLGLHQKNLKTNSSAAMRVVHVDRVLFSSEIDVDSADEQMKSMILTLENQEVAATSEKKKANTSCCFRAAHRTHGNTITDTTQRRLTATIHTYTYPARHQPPR